jgi:uncharacterized membrane protein YphA (DoxX/SURF4 family)
MVTGECLCTGSYSEVVGAGYSAGRCWLVLVGFTLGALWVLFDVIAKVVAMMVMNMMLCFIVVIGDVWNDKKRK